MELDKAVILSTIRTWERNQNNPSLNRLGLFTIGYLTGLVGYQDDLTSEEIHRVLYFIKMFTSYVGITKNAVEME